MGEHIGATITGSDQLVQNTIQYQRGCFGTSRTLGRFGALTDLMADQTRFKGHGIRDRVMQVLRYQITGSGW